VAAAACWLLLAVAVPSRATEAPQPHDHAAEQADTAGSRKADAHQEQRFDWGLPQTHDPATDEHATTDEHTASGDHADQGALPADPNDHSAHTPQEHEAVTGAGDDHATSGDHGDDHAAAAEQESKPTWRWVVVGGVAALNLAVLIAAAIVGHRSDRTRRRARDRADRARRTALSNA
jgi:hypothetical protein